MEIPENRLIDKIRRFADRSRDVLRGIGDDGAVIKLSQGSYVFVQDAMVEHVHFKFSFTNPYDVGKKAVYVNISDVLSMGALPLYFLVTIGITPALTSKDIGRLYHGMRQAAREFGAIMIGGDTTESKSDFFIDVSMIGKLVTKTYGRDRAKEEISSSPQAPSARTYGLHLLLESKPTKNCQPFLNVHTSPKPPYPYGKKW